MATISQTIIVLNALITVSPVMEVHALNAKMASPYPQETAMSVRGAALPARNAPTVGINLFAAHADLGSSSIPIKNVWHVRNSVAAAPAHLNARSVCSPTQLIPMQLMDASPVVNLCVRCVTTLTRINAMNVSQGTTLIVIGCVRSALKTVLTA